MDEKAVTVSQINRYINNKMKLDDKLTDIYIRGEISNYKNEMNFKYLNFGCNIVESLADIIKKLK